MKCVLNVDGAGRLRTLSVGTNSFDGIEELFDDVSEALDAPVETDDTVASHRRLVGVRRARGAVGVRRLRVAGRGAGLGPHPPHTMNKIGSRDLQNPAVLIAKAVLRATDRGYERASKGEIRESLADGYVRELRVGDRWHYND